MSNNNSARSRTTQWTLGNKLTVDRPFFRIIHAGSPNGHSPVLNLSKSGGLDQGSTGDQSDHSDGGHSPAPSLIRDEEEHDLSDDNVSEVDEREMKDEGM